MDYYQYNRSCCSKEESFLEQIKKEYDVAVTKLDNIKMLGAISTSTTA